MTYNNELARKIYDALKASGADIGNAAVGIIEQVLDDEWVSVDERLPERNPKYPEWTEPVMIWVYNPVLKVGIVDTTAYHYDLGGWLTDEPGATYESYGHAVTHWRPLPPGPEAK